MLLPLVYAFLVLLVPFVTGLTLYRGGGRWKGLGATLMGVPVTNFVLLFLWLVLAGVSFP